jgi:hypothetical protein
LFRLFTIAHLTVGFRAGVTCARRREIALDGVDQREEQPVERTLAVRS